MTEYTVGQSVTVLCEDDRGRCVPQLGKVVALLPDGRLDVEVSRNVLNTSAQWVRVF